MNLNSRVCCKYNVSTGSSYVFLHHHLRQGDQLTFCTGYCIGLIVSTITSANFMPIDSQTNANYLFSIYNCFFLVKKLFIACLKIFFFISTEQCPGSPTEHLCTCVREQSAYTVKKGKEKPTMFEIFFFTFSSQCLHYFRSSQSKEEGQS